MVKDCHEVQRSLAVIEEFVCYGKAEQSTTTLFFLRPKYHIYPGINNNDVPLPD